MSENLEMRPEKPERPDWRFGRIQKRDSEYLGRIMLRLGISGWRRGAKRFVDEEKEYVKFGGVREGECKGSTGPMETSDWRWDEKMTTRIKFEPHFSLC